MNIAVFGRTPEKKAEIKAEIKKFGFEYDELKPDLVVSYGGDGTFLNAERDYPGVLKALFRFSKICKKCHNLPITHALELLKKKKYMIEEHNKIEGKLGKHKLLATNDIVVRNIDPTRAIRFKVSVNGKEINDEFIGDGIVVATTFGSTGYFESITREKFKKGYGVAFNNVTARQKPLYLKNKDKVKLTITRGSAHVGVDNDQRILVLKEGKSITIKVSKKIAKVVSF